MATKTRLDSWKEAQDFWRTFHALLVDIQVLINEAPEILKEEPYLKATIKATQETLPDSFEKVYVCCSITTRRLNEEGEWVDATNLPDDPS